jgi:uncharacterized damage-inducible protein DinB
LAAIGYTVCMNFYGARDLARQFRVVRANTIKIAEEIDEKNYSFQPAKDTRTVAQLLTHIATLHRFSMRLHGDDKATTLAGYDFMSVIGPLRAEEEKTRSKAELVALLKEGGEQFAAFLETLNDDSLAEMVEMPPGGDPPKSRFEMLMAVKEQEMHHRGQLMLIERLLGMVPHTTRAQQERMAALAAAQR